MSDIKEEQKRLYKRAEENDRTNTISIQDLFDERIKQNKRIEELSLALESAEQRINKAYKVLDKIKEYITTIDTDYAIGCWNKDEDFVDVKKDILELLEEIE